jgi:hypothetical protein
MLGCRGSLPRRELPTATLGHTGPFEKPSVWRDTMDFRQSWTREKERQSDCLSPQHASICHVAQAEAIAEYLQVIPDFLRSNGRKR